MSDNDTTQAPDNDSAASSPSQIGNKGQAYWDQLIDEAADWLVGMDSGTAEPEEFERWRSADPRRAVAFAQVVSSLAALDRAKPILRGSPALNKSAFTRRNLLAGAVIASAAGSGALTLFASANANTSVQTSVGERRVSLLPSVGRLELNTDSLVRFRVAPSLTEIWLLKGEAAVNSTGILRPFILYTKYAEFEVADAVINVRLRENALDLAVIRGRCSLLSKRLPLTNIQTVAAQSYVMSEQTVQVTSNKHLVRQITGDDVAAISAWQDDEIVFNGQTLSSVVTEYNRYLIKKIVITDPSLAPLRIGGRFSSRDPKFFLHSIEGSFGIKVTIATDGTVALSK